MAQNPLRIPVLVALAVGLTYITYLIWRPFVSPIGWAAAFAILFAPLQNRLASYVHSSGLRAAIMTAGVILLIVVPVSLLGIAVAAEIVRLYSMAQHWDVTGQAQWLQRLASSAPVHYLRQELGQLMDTTHLNVTSLARALLEQLGKATLAKATGVAQNFYQFIFALVLMLFTLYVFFRDGRRIARWLTELLPLPSAQRQRIVREFSEVIAATMVGDIVVALIQGALGGLAFLVLGLSAPLFWGAIMAFLSVLPVIGSPLVYVPAAIVLLVRGEIVTAALLLLWGGLVVSQIDNILRPILISGRTKLHTLNLFFSLLGGIYVFGFFGIIAGPLVAALFVTMTNLYREALADAPGTEAPPARTPVEKE